MKINAVETGAAELLVRFYDQNDEDALSEFFLRFKDLAFRIAFNVLNNTADAEDITQQTFVQLLKKQAICKAAYDGDDYKVKSWLLAVIYNAARMQYNSKKKNKTYELTEGANVESQKTNESETSSDKDGVLSKLNKAIFDLPEKYRVPILMRYHQDMSIDDISKTLASQPGTIRSILSRGVSILRNKLSGENVTLSSVAAIELIGNIPFPIPRQEISMSLIKSLKASNPHVVKAIHTSQVKISLFLKSVIAASVCATIVSGYFVLNKKEEITTKEKAKSSQSIPLVNSKYNGQKNFWDFSIENGSDIATIQSKTIYSKDSKAITNVVSKTTDTQSAVIQLPTTINKPTKITLTCKVAPNRGKYKDPRFNCIEYIPLLDGKPQLGQLLYHYKRDFRLYSSEPSWSAQNDHMYYIFENVCISTSLDGVILKIHRFDNFKGDPNIGFIIANYDIEKIDVAELDAKEHEKVQAEALTLLKKQEEKNKK